jgi:hypothetical protein
MGASWQGWHGPVIKTLSTTPDGINVFVSRTEKKFPFRSLIWQPVS